MSEAGSPQRFGDVAGDGSDGNGARARHGAAADASSSSTPGSELPTFSPRAFRWFRRYLRFYLPRHFTAIRLSRAGGRPEAGDRPCIVYTNHPSWWDPLMFLWVQHSVFEGRPQYGPFDEKALEKYGLFKKLGAFGVDLETARGAARFLRTARAVLARPGAVLWITAQGRFADVRERPLALRPGLAHLAQGVPDVEVLPLAVEYAFWTERHPEALLRFGEPVTLDGALRRDKPAATAHFEARLAEAMDALAAESRARDPAAFETLLRGSVGVGGIYDAWRRFVAWVRGRSFHAGHGEDSR